MLSPCCTLPCTLPCTLLLPCTIYCPASFHCTSVVFSHRPCLPFVSAMLPLYHLLVLLHHTTVVTTQAQKRLQYKVIGLGCIYHCTTTTTHPQPTTPNPTCTLVALLVPQPLAHLPTHCLSFSRAVDPPHL